MPGQAKSIKHQPRYRGERAPADLEFDAANGKVDYSAFYRFKHIAFPVKTLRICLRLRWGRVGRGERSLHLASVGGGKGIFFASNSIYSEPPVRCGFSMTEAVTLGQMAEPWYTLRRVL